MKKWDQPPTKAEVESEVKAFFSLLQSGKLDEAKAAVAHQFDDWESQVWSIWQDTYLIYLEELDQEVDDDTLEGKVWCNDLSWLNDLEIENTFHWDDEGDRVDAEGEHLFVNLIYKGEVVDVSGDFRVVKEDDGYRLMRESIHAA